MRARSLLPSGTYFPALLVAAAASLLGAPPVHSQPAASTRALAFSDDQGNTFDALITFPAAAPLGASVLLIGGGSVTDEHWTVPPSVEQDGVVTRLTIDGRETRDADTIAAALVDAGFAVLQWSSIRRNDPERIRNPAFASPISFASSVDLSRRALALLRSQPEIDAHRIALVGHSLGATRAWQIADQGVFAVVSLAGAYTARLREPPSELAADAWDIACPFDTNGDGALSLGEFDAWRTTAIELTTDPSSFKAADRDHDGFLRPWELAAALRLARLNAGDETALDTEPMFRAGLPWPIDRAEDTAIPWLALFGGLDPISICGPFIERWRRDAGRNDVSVEYFPALGHQLSLQQDERSGPISPLVVQRLTHWLTDHARVP